MQCSLTRTSAAPSCASSAASIRARSHCLAVLGVVAWSSADSERARLGRRSGDRHPAFRDVGSALDSLWPVKRAPAPPPGAILPAKRIVAFYGNPKSRKMGILGEFPPDVMLRKL